MKKLENRHPFYSALLRLYPRPYRQRYSEEILQTTDDMLSGAPNNRTRLGVKTQLAIDLSVNAGKQQLNYAGAIIQSEIPSYIKRNAVLAGIMLLPFLAALGANGLDRLINNRNLYNTWLWHAQILRIWVIILPALAFLFMAASYLAFVIKSSSSKQSLIKRMFDVRHIWPIILPGVVAFGVLFLVEFHDSGQCLAYSPGHVVTHLGQAWQCTISHRANHIFTFRNL